MPDPTPKTMVKIHPFGALGPQILKQKEEPELGDTLSGWDVITAEAKEFDMLAFDPTRLADAARKVSHPHSILTPSSPHPHLVPTSSSTHPHLIPTSSPPHPHLILTSSPPHLDTERRRKRSIRWIYGRRGLVRIEHG